MTQMQFLITGATGYLGMRLCKRLIDAGHRVKGILRPNSSSTGKISALEVMGVETVTFDLGDVHAATQAMQNVDVAFHLGWQSNRISQNQQRFGAMVPAREVNLVGMQSLCAAARAASLKRFVFTSSISVYGPEHTWGPLPRREEDVFPNLSQLPNPAYRFYAATKVEAESILRSTLPPTEYVILRPSLVYGADAQFAESFVRQTLSGETAGAAPAPAQWVHVDDCARACELAATAPAAANGTYTIAGEKAVLNQSITAETVRLYNAAMGHYQDGLIDWNPRMPRYDVEAARRDLGFTAMIGIQEGLRDMIGSVVPELRALA